MTGAEANITLAIALAAGVFAQCAARHLRVPGIVLLLVLGAVLGPDGLEWIDPRSLGSGLFWIVDFGVAIILFEGGLNLEMSRLRREESSIRRLITVGAIITLLGASLAVRILLDWPWSLAFLFGSLVVVTGPTVVTPLLRDMRLRPRIKTVLEAEGVLIDPIGAILAVLVLQVVMAPATETIASELRFVVLRLVFGICAGFLGGLLIGWLLRSRFAVPQGYQNIFTLGSVVLLFQGCEELMSHSGILAVTIAGVVVGNLKTPVDRDLREFKDQLTTLLIGLLFTLLAADVRLQDAKALGFGGVSVVIALIIAVRPLSVWLSTWKSNLSAPEKLFICWIAPRGIVAAAVASLTAMSMESKGISGGAELRALVFLTIAGTVVLVGLTARIMATILRLRLPSRDRVAILGAHGLGLALGKELRDADVPVVFLDSDPKRCHQAEEMGFPVVFGDALEERTLLRAQIELVGTVIGLTPNDHLNSIFVGQARKLYNVPQGFVVLETMPDGEPPEYVRRHEAEVLFDGPRDAERWDVRARHGEMEVERFMFVEKPKAGAPSTSAMEPGDSAASSGERFVILTVRQDKRVTPMTLDFQPRQGDVAAVAIYTPERETALRRLRQIGWHEHKPEQEQTTVK